MVATENLAEVAPPATVKVAGTVADPALLASAIVKPPAGAGVPSVSVPMEDLPPTTEVGLRVKPVIAGGLTVNCAVFESPLKVDVIVAETTFATALVLTVNVACVDPAGIVTIAGTMVDVEVVDKLTVNPPFAAAAVSVKVAVDVLLPMTAEGLNVSVDKPGGVTVRVAA